MRLVRQRFTPVGPRDGIDVYGEGQEQKEEEEEVIEGDSEFGPLDVEQITLK